MRLVILFLSALSLFGAASIAGDACALVVSGSSLHCSGDYYGPHRPSQHYGSDCG